MSEYYVKLKPGEHVVYVNKDEAFDALLVSLGDDGNAEMLLFLSFDNKGLPRVEIRKQIFHKSNTDSKPYFWVPGEPETQGGER